MALEVLPSAHDSRQRSSWPIGWWISPATYGCCGTKRGHKIRHGHRVYLTGVPGEMFCAKHAPAYATAGSKGG